MTDLDYNGTDDIGILAQEVEALGLLALHKQEVMV